MQGRALGGRVRGWRLWVFRLGLATLVPALVLVALELVLWLAGFGHPAAFLLRARIGGEANLIQNDRFAWPYFGRDLARQPFPLAIPERKAQDTIRIFVFGESAAYGDPQPEFGLSRMLEALLSQRYPAKRFEVVNAAMTAINSHAVLRIARDCGRHQGDIWVVYMGNNEVVGPYGAGTVFGPQVPSVRLVRTGLALKETRTGQLLESLVNRLAKAPPEKREWGGMRMFLKSQVRQDTPQMAVVYANFHKNLEDIIEAGRRSGVQVVVGTVAVNLKDCAPFASLHRANLQPADLTRWNGLYQQALDSRKNGRFAEAVVLLGQAAEIDDSFADLQYLWGCCCLELGQTASAAEHFMLALDQDVLRFRADSRINQIIREAASTRAAQGVHLVETQEALARESPHRLIGNELLYEHAHLNFKGNYLLARAFAEAVVTQLPAAQGWRDSGEAWPSLEQCAARLGWTEWNQRESVKAMVGRLDDPPFTTQLNHAEMSQKLVQELERLRTAVSSAALGQATQQCHAALQTAPGDWVLTKVLAALRQAAGDLAGAAESWRSILQRLPHYTEGWQALGQILTQQRQDAQAEAAFGQALKLEPNSAASLIGLAQLRARQGKKDQAIALYEQVLRQKPHWSPAHLELGKALQAAGQTEAAQRHFRQALESRLLTPPALGALGSFCFEQGWYAEACTNFADALRLDPTDAAKRVNLGITLGVLGRRAEAQDQFAEALRLDPTFAEAHVRLGTELGRQGRHAEALGHFAEAARLNPDFVEARLNLGIGLLNERRNEEALQQFQEVLRQHPTNAVARDYVQRLTAKTRQGAGQDLKP